MEFSDVRSLQMASLHVKNLATHRNFAEITDCRRNFQSQERKNTLLELIQSNTSHSTHKPSNQTYFQLLTFQPVTKMMSLWGNQYDPWKEVNRMKREIGKVFEDFGDVGTEKGMTTWRPLMDIKETDKDICLHCELPGVKKEDVNIELNKGLLTISGEKKEEKKVEKDKYSRIERSYGKFSRSLTVPEDMREDQIKAKFDNGVLEVTFPKPPQLASTETKRITIS